MPRPPPLSLSLSLFIDLDQSSDRLPSMRFVIADFFSCCSAQLVPNRGSGVIAKDTIDSTSPSLPFLAVPVLHSAMLLAATCVVIQTYRPLTYPSSSLSFSLSLFPHQATEL
jgi:hypothetical protein